MTAVAIMGGIYYSRLPNLSKTCDFELVMLTTCWPLWDQWSTTVTPLQYQTKAPTAVSRLNVLVKAQRDLCLCYKNDYNLVIYQFVCTRQLFVRKIKMADFYHIIILYLEFIQCQPNEGQKCILNVIMILKTSILCELFLLVEY